MLKWRMKRGVTGLRPPPGGAQAAATVISYRNRSTYTVSTTPIKHVKWQVTTSTDATLSGKRRGDEVMNREGNGEVEMGGRKDFFSL